MASTEKVSLSLDSGALLLARRAAEIEGLSLSAYFSALAKNHAWASQRARWTEEEQSAADARLAEVDEQELKNDQERRAAG